MQMFDNDEETEAVRLETLDNKVLDYAEGMGDFVKTDLGHRYIDPEKAPLVMESFMRDTGPKTHETFAVFDRVACMENDINIRILEHPSILANPEWYAKAYKAQSLLYDLYNTMAETVLDEVVEAEKPNE
jgi:hypothetical protein